MSLIVTFKMTREQARAALSAMQRGTADSDSLRDRLRPAYEAMLRVVHEADRAVPTLRPGIADGSTWIRQVRIVGYAATPNENIPPGTRGDLEVLEVSLDGRVMQARFHVAKEGYGSGLVTWPLFEVA